MSDQEKVKKVKVWLVKHPIDQYNEDVKKLARANHLRVIDADMAYLLKSYHEPVEGPELTLKKDRVVNQELPTIPGVRNQGPDTDAILADVEKKTADMLAAAEQKAAEIVANAETQAKAIVEQTAAAAGAANKKPAAKK